MTGSERVPLRIVAYHHDLDFGGMGRAARFVLPVLDDLGAVDRFCLSTRRDSHAPGQRGRLDLRSVRYVVGLLMRSAIRAVKPADLVYVPIAQHGLPLLRDCGIIAMWRLRRVPVLLHLHGSVLAQRLQRVGWRGAVLRLLIGPAHWLVLSPELASEISKLPRVGRVGVCRNPAPPVGGEAASHARAGICWVGALSRNKGFDLVLASVQALRQEGVDAPFVVAGELHDGTLDPRDVADVYLGNVHPDDIPSIWDRAAVTAVPSRFVEGQPFVFLEALQAGVVVAGTFSLGAAELFASGAVARIEATEASVTGFFRDTLANHQHVQCRQQRAWAGLRDHFTLAEASRAIATAVLDITTERRSA